MGAYDPSVSTGIAATREAFAFSDASSPYEQGCGWLVLPDFGGAFSKVVCYHPGDFVSRVTEN